MEQSLSKKKRIMEQQLIYTLTDQRRSEPFHPFPTTTMAEQHRRRRVVLFPCPLQGHINPMLQLATILHSHSKGALSITILHPHFNSPNPSNYPNFTFIPISDGLSSSQTQISSQDVISLLHLLNQNCASPFRDCLVNNILSNKNEPPVACIISDATMYFTQSVADSLHLPRLVLRTGSALNLVLFASYPLFQQQGYLPIKDSELETPLQGLPPLKVKDIPVMKYPNFEGLCELILIMVNQTKASSGLIFNSFESLEQSTLENLQQQLSIPTFLLGPFHKSAPASSSSILKEDHNCISWLNTRATSSVIYVSFGSIASVNEAQLAEIALGLANSEQSFLWVIRPGLVPGDNYSTVDEMMQAHGGRGCIVKWAPQVEVLAHPAIGGFFTHSGWNSTLESICEGVPMLCWPCYGDQMANARYVSEVWRVGFLLENGLGHGEIERYIRRLMVKENNKEREEIMGRVGDLKEKAELCLRKGGNSFKSLERLSEFIFSM